MSEHYIEKCKCGFVIRQCRCVGEKTIRIVPCDHAHTPPPRQEGMTREEVEYLREQVKYHDPLCIDNIEEDGCTCGHATATRLLAGLGEVGK